MTTEQQAREVSNALTELSSYAIGEAGDATVEFLVDTIENFITQAAEENKKLRDQRDFLVEEYERAVGCGPQGFVHCAGHLFNAITNAKIESKIVKQEAVEDKRIADAVRGAASGEVWTNAVSGFVDEPDGTRVFIIPVSVLEKQNESLY